MKPAKKNRQIRLSLFLLLCPFVIQAQSLTGLWTGTVHNDSASVRKDQLFEIALTEKDGKVTGYSRNEFIVDDTLYVIVKKVKGKIDGNTCAVTDDGIISCNFMDKVDKGVTVTSTFLLDPVKNNWYLSTWKTNVPRKKYYAVGGNMDMEAEKDLSASKLITHLEELNKASELVIYREKTEVIPVLRVATPQRIPTSYTSKLNEEPTGSLAVKEAVALPAIPAPATTAVPETAAAEKPQPANEQVTTKKAPAQTGSPVTAIPATAEKPAAPVITTKKPAVEKPAVTKPEPAPIAKVSNPAPVSKSAAATGKPVQSTTAPATPVVPDTKPAAPVVTAAALKKEFSPPPGALVVKKPADDPVKLSAVISGRKSEFSQEVLFSSDSLVLSLYDNGEIDGDTVSVYLNGEVVMPAQGLKSSAIRKTIHMDHEIEEFTLVMFAESLGKYPPNTGLLVIRDGNDIYNLRFSSDFTKSTGIVFRRKQ